MLEAHEVEILLKAGHPKPEVARLAEVSRCSFPVLLVYSNSLGRR
jgi:hypothetical protein